MAYTPSYLGPYELPRKIAAIIKTVQDALVLVDAAVRKGTSGTATVASGQTSIVVTHGYGATPVLQDITVTPTNNLGSAAKFWISTPTSTQFTINVNADPTGSGATFVWRVKKSPTL
jgi:hypothetical protein